jgi:hypothetical protein
MKITTLLLALLISFMPLDAKEKAKGKDKSKHNPKHKNEQASWPNSGKHEDSDSNDEFKRQTEGHRAQDLNGDGVISRHEWPGNDASFAELDLDRNGVLDKRDRALDAQQRTRSRVHK